MAAAKVTAVILPGTSLYTKIPFTGAKPFFEAGCAVAIGSDFNPGSCVADNLPMLMTVAAVHCGFSKAQALAAVTFAPACALGFGKSKGTLATGYDADLIALPLKNSSEFVADLGRTRPSRVWLAGISQTQFKETHT